MSPHIQRIRSVRFFEPSETPIDAERLVKWEGKDPTPYVDALRNAMSNDAFAEWSELYGPNEVRTVAWWVTIYRCECCSDDEVGK